MRVLLTSFLMLVPIPAYAAALHVWTFNQVDTVHPEHDPFQDAIDAFKHSYRDSPGAATLPVLRMSVQLPLVLILGWWITVFLPPQRHLRPCILQAARAAVARSRMR